MSFQEKESGSKISFPNRKPKNSLFLMSHFAQPSIAVFVVMPTEREGAFVNEQRFKFLKHAVHVAERSAKHFL